MSDTPIERMERIEREGLVADGKWNRRVVRHPCGSLCIHEVHYRKDGTVRAWSQTVTEAVDAEDGLEGLRESVEATYEQSQHALSRPILEWNDIPHGPN